MRGLAQFRGVQNEGDRPVAHARAGVPEYRGKRDARREVRKRSGRYGSGPRGGNGAEVQGRRGRRENSTLWREGVDARRACGGGRQYREDSGDGGFRNGSSGTPAGRSADEEASSRRYLHALLLRAPPRAG